MKKSAPPEKPEMAIRQAGIDDIERVAWVLGAAAARLVERSQPLWSAQEVSEAGVAEHVRAGMYHLAFVAGEPAGAFRFQLEDRWFWPDIAPGTSAFVHKVAVHPLHQGRGLAHVLLRHACVLTRQHGRDFLRLDCVAGRPKLRALYERFGFRHHSRKVIGTGAFERFELDVRTAPP